MARAPEIGGKKFGVLGAARSGLAVAGLLAKHGATVFVSDRAPAEKMKAAEEELRRIGLEFEFGTNSPRVLDVDMLVVSPGVPSDAAPVKEAIARGIPVIAELEAASWFCAAPMVAITGTNGKTTTTTLVGRMCTDARVPCVVAGNIGTAFSEVVEQTQKDGTAVLEVSSFQLDHIARFRPVVAVILNITQDHLDRYEHRFEKYIAAKLRIFENQMAHDLLVYNADDEVTRRSVEEHAPKDVALLPFSTRRSLATGAFVERDTIITVVRGTRHELVPVKDLSVKGEHNLANAMAASLCAIARSIPVASIRATLRNFKGVEHRLEFVRDLDGITFVNDSKATNVDSLWYALRSFERPLIVLMGGRDKGNDYRPLMDPVRQHVKAIVAIGESASKVEGAFAGVVPTVVAGSLVEAVNAARRLASSGDIILLSPACASFDWFDNYEHRGKAFKNIVMRLASAGSARPSHSGRSNG
jgi:UDP-N-acetylmuramoylalanine--D-glutamate ligase